jgi:hypothetical protein
MGKYDLGYFYDYPHIIIPLCIIFFGLNYVYLYGQFYPIDVNYEIFENE